MSNNWEQKLKPWLIQGSLILAIGLLFWFGIRPLHGLIRMEMDEIQKLDVLREHKSRQMQRLPELEKQHALIEERSKELDIIFTKEELVEFIRTLERLAQETGVEITITSRDNTLLESKISLPLPGSKPPSVAASPGAADPTDKVDPPTPNPAPSKRGGSKTESGLLSELPLKNYIRLSITVKAPYRAMVAYLHKLETLPTATEIIGVKVKEAELERTEAGTAAEVVAKPTKDESVVLATDFDMLVYIQE